MREHVPVMLSEVLEGFRPWDEAEVAVDATLGLGGHAWNILKNCENVFLIGFDQDPEARKEAENRLSEFAGRFEIKADNFRDIGKLKEKSDWEGASVVFFDLGVSNMQISEPERGFSFQADGPLDMRMDTSDDGSERGTAEDILSAASIAELTEIFRKYGEERYAYEIARGIIRYREGGGSLRSTGELVDLIRKILPAPVQRKMGGHPARKIFQALRIAVNDELGALEEALGGALEILKPGGKILVISYHSLEDRIVKRTFRSWYEKGLGSPAPRRPMVPSKEEVEKNYKARSAKLRIFVSEKEISEKGEDKDAPHRLPT